MLKIPPDWGTFFASIVSFLVFWFIFRRILFDPFLRLLARRQERLESLGKRTQQLLQQSAAADERRRQEMAGVRRHGITDRDKQRRMAEEQVAQVIEQARLAARQSVEQVRAEIQRQLRVAQEQLDAVGEDLAIELAERVLGRRFRGGGPQVHSDN